MTNSIKLPTGDEREITFHDQFQNKVTITKLANVTIKKVTQTSKNSGFEFLGDTYSYALLDSSEVLKVYWSSYHSERQLIKDKYGRLFHYRYDEEMNFDGDDDREDILWTRVADEADSDELSQKGGLGLLREPYVASAENNWVAAHEIIHEQS